MILTKAEMETIRAALRYIDGYTSMTDEEIALLKRIDAELNKK